MTKTLLAVEDSKTMRKVLGITFANDEFEAVLAESPQQAISQLDQLRPDMVLLDVTLGEVNGYDLCRQVKSRAPGTPVMIGQVLGRVSRTFSGGFAVEFERVIEGADADRLVSGYQVKALPLTVTG